MTMESAMTDSYSYIVPHGTVRYPGYCTGQSQHIVWYQYVYHYSTYICTYILPRSTSSYREHVLTLNLHITKSHAIHHDLLPTNSKSVSPSSQRRGASYPPPSDAKNETRDRENNLTCA